MNKFISILKTWFPFAVTITLMCGIVYVAVQQNYRLSANDLQLLVSNDAAYAISKGANPRAMVPSSPADLRQTIAPWLVIYDEKGNAFASGAILDGKIPQVPPGVLNYAKANGIDMVTWQPRKGVRQALVVRKAASNPTYLVACGRSLGPTEERISLLGKQIVTGWLISLFVLLLLFWVFNRANTSNVEQETNQPVEQTGMPESGPLS